MFCYSCFALLDCHIKSVPQFSVIILNVNLVYSSGSI